MGSFFFLLVVVAAVLLIMALLAYNALQGKAQEVHERRSNVQVAISKKLALVNQLIDVVKNYQEGEQLVMLKVSQDTSAAAVEGSYHQSGNVLAAVQGIAEKFPNLKANEQYNHLVAGIKECELNIQEWRERYNAAVRAYNTERTKIPTVFFASAVGFPEAPYMEFDLSGLQEVGSLKEFKTDDGQRLQQFLSDTGSKLAQKAQQAGQVGINAAAQAGKVGMKTGKEFVDKIKESQKQKQSAAQTDARPQENTPQS